MKSPFNPFNLFNHFNPPLPPMKHALLLLSLALLAAGCGRAKRAAGGAVAAAADTTKAVAAKTGKAVGEHAGAFFAGVGEGVERVVCDYAVRIDGDALAAAGASVTLVQRVSGGRDAAPALALYLVNERPLAGTLRLRLLTADGREIGRGEAPLDRGSEGAGHVRVPIPADTPSTLVKTIALTLVPSGK